MRPVPFVEFNLAVGFQVRQQLVYVAVGFLYFLFQFFNLGLQNLCLLLQRFLFLPELLFLFLFAPLPFRYVVNEFPAVLLIFDELGRVVFDERQLFFDGMQLEGILLQLFCIGTL